MFTLSGRDSAWNRPEFLRVGSLALGGLPLPGLLAAKARAADAGRLTTDKAVVLLFLQGGPSQIETFDPNPLDVGQVRVAREVPKTVVDVVSGGKPIAPLA